jgi:serine/threonine-protein kinase
LLLNNRYLMQNVAGPSTLGRVFIARDENLAGREVAIRVIDQPGIDASSLNRIAARVAGVQHENVVEITDYGELPQGAFFAVMDRLDFRTLQQVMRATGKLRISRAVTLLKQIAGGIEAIHAAGLLHGALNPNNVFVETRFNTLGGIAEEEVAKVSDFGWDELRTLDATGDLMEERGGRAPLGAIEYLSPEQVQPGKPLDQSVDTYSLGALAYYLFSGRPPFSGDLMQVVVQKMMSEPPVLEKISPELPDQAAALIRSALSRDAARRPKSIDEWMLDLEAATFSVQAISPDGPPGVEIIAPKGTTVYLDDEEQGEVDAGGLFSLLLVQPGVHLVAVKLPDGHSQERVLEVPASSTDGPIRITFDWADLATPKASAASMPAFASANGADGEEEGVPEMATVVSSGSRETHLAAPDADGEQPLCEKCGAAIRATSKFCRACGAPVAARPVPILAAPTGEIEAPTVVEVPAPEQPPAFVDTLGNVGGVHFEVPGSTTPKSEPEVAPAVAPAVARMERPKTVESTVQPIATQPSPAAAPAKARPNSYYLTVGAVIGLVLLLLFGGVGSLVYWFVLARP